MFGWGDWSSSGNVLAATEPDIEAAIITTLEGVNVKLSWSANTQDNGSTITAYQVLINSASGSLLEDSQCDGT